MVQGDVSPAELLCITHLNSRRNLQRSSWIAAYPLPFAAKDDDTKQGPNKLFIIGMKCSSNGQLACYHKHSDAWF